MLFVQRSPALDLNAVVKTIWRAQGSREEFSAPEPIVPDGCVEIILNLGDRFICADTGDLQPRAMLAGQMTRPVVALPTGDVDLLGIRFWTGRAGSAFRIPMHELQDSLADASSTIPGLDKLTDDLRNIPDHRRVGWAEAALTRLIATKDDSPNAVDHALAVIVSSRGAVSIERVARAVGITRRHLERQFKEHVGLGVKQVARITRVHAALRLMARGPELSGAEIALSCGYSDQAHLIRECKAFTGRTPARLMSSERSLGGLMREGAEVRSA